MFKILRDSLAIVGIGFAIAVYTNPGLVPSLVDTAKYSYARSVLLIQLVVEEWKK
jgi:hypothetical protein